ncbi:TPA: hypothetical protein ACKRQV_001276 [Pseudomonas aeruginosa]
MMSAQSPGSSLRTGDASSTHMHLSRVAHLLGGYLYRYSSEVKLHEAIAEVLDQAGIIFERERILDAKNRADFWVDGLVIEVKVDGTLSEALRQVDRYIHLPQVTGVLLASTQRWAAAPLKDRPAWGGKAFQMVRLGRQAL